MGSVAYGPPQKAIYKWYFSCQLGDYVLPTTFYGNQKQPLRRVIVSKDFPPNKKPKMGTVFYWNGMVFYRQMALNGKLYQHYFGWSYHIRCEENDFFADVHQNLPHDFPACWPETGFRGLVRNMVLPQDPWWQYIYRSMNSWMLIVVNYTSFIYPMKYSVDFSGSCKGW